MNIRLIAAGTALILVGTLLSASSAIRDTPQGATSPTDPVIVVAGRSVQVPPRPPALTSAAAPTVAWPSGQFDAGGARVRVLERAAAEQAGVDGLLLSVSAPVATELRLNYKGFAEAYGGAYGSRLRVTRLPGCAATTPERAGCRDGTPAPATNDLRSATLTTPVPQGETTLAVTAGPSSAKGDYQATPLAASATWNVGTQTGDFTWSYPLRMPPVPGGLAPALSLTYSSSTIDGRTSGTNNQGAWVGDGFSLWPGFIERKYKACKDDGVPKDSTYQAYPADQCWAYDNATITFSGKGGELIPAGANLWRLKDDDGTRVEKLTGDDTDTGNGDNDNEHWRVTTPDGTRMYFGKNRWTGWTAGTRQTNSTFTTAVFGDDSGEPCHDSDFASSWCQQAWRWNLDFVEDTHGNAVAYYYTKEGNHYGRNLRPAQETAYTRAGWLNHAEYGLRTGAMYPAKPLARVDFTVKERCLRSDADCAESNISAHPEYWEDTPWDLHCDSGQDCKDDHGAVSPTFWTRKRLTKVTTKILKADGSYRDVDSWAFDHAWGTADVDRQLLLSSITRTGEAASPTVTLPPVTFAYTQRPNRVDRLGDDIGPVVKNRVGAVYNEYGGQLDINYSNRDCTTTDLPSVADNRRLCFPTYWAKTSGDENPTLDWFHKYVVTQTVQTDRTGGAPDTVTTYDYSIGQPAWHYADDDGLVPEKYKTWSQWHGFSRVRVKTGGGGQTDYWYFQGMDGDRASTGGGTRSVSISDGEGGSHPDHESLQGRTLKTIAYLGGAPVAKTVTTPWHHQTASRTRSWGTQTANLIAVKTTRRMTLLDSGWRETRTTNNSFNLTTGAVAQANDAGDIAVTGDEACTDTTFAADGARVIGAVAQVRTVAKPCGTPPDLSRDVITDKRTFYDNGGFRAAPTAGNVTAKDEAVAAGTYVTEIRTSYDALGRARTATDALGGVTTTDYTETGGLTTKVTVTTPPATPGDATTRHVTSKELDPAWGTPLKETDAGSKVTTTSYDALGRILKVWAAGRPTSDKPDREFSYLVAPNTITAIATKKLTNADTQLTTYTLYDGLLRVRQVQAPALGDNGTAGRLISDSFYTGFGQIDHSYEPYYADGVPQAALFGVVTPGQIETQHWYTYDDLGRKTADRLLVGNSDAVEKWRTTYEYGGDWTRVTPPAGGVVVTTKVDAHNRKTSVSEGPVHTNFGYNTHGLLASVTGPGGIGWSYGYDYRGRKVSETDPDKGNITYAYDDLDRVVATTDGRGAKITTRFDGLGRKTATYDATNASPGVKLAEWVYDTSRKGQLYSSTRWVGGGAYTTQFPYYDNLNRPTQTVVTLPSSEGALAPVGGWVFNTTYNPDGTVKASSFPQAGELGAESLSYDYDPIGRLTGVKSSLYSATLPITSTVYGKTNQVIDRKLSAGGTTVEQAYTYEFGTQRLKQTTTTHTGAAGTDSSIAYSYAPGGNITQMVDTSRDGVDNQCFTYDTLARLTHAWTLAGPGACNGTPGGIAPYDVTYTYDDTGNRTGDGSRTYSYNGHRLTAASDGSSYSYDADGNTTYRKTPDSAQTLSWDAEGRLASVTDDRLGTTSYLYDADGQRLIRRDRTGTTLYLPGMELHAVGGLFTGATRYYDFGAMRTGSGVTFLVNDHHGTTELAINAASGALSRRRHKPFGEIRATVGGWPAGNEKGFVGGTIDAGTGLTTLGARAYDPATGRFLSVDPIVVMGDSQQMNGYAYAGNNPTTSSDPDGMCPIDKCGYGTCNLGKCYRHGPVDPTNPGSDYYDYDENGNSIRRGPSNNVIPTPRNFVELPGRQRPVCNIWCFIGRPNMPSWNSASQPGVSATYNTNATTTTDQGLVVVRFFIQGKSAAFGILEGDDRSYSLQPDAPYRIKAVWNTKTGKVTYHVTDSCYGSLLKGGCVAQNPIKPGGANSIKVTKSGKDVLEFEYGGLNSAIPCCAANGKMRLSVQNGRLTARRTGDPYPDMEVIQVRGGSANFVQTGQMSRFGGPATHPVGSSAIKAGQSWRDSFLRGISCLAAPTRC